MIATGRALAFGFLIWLSVFAVSVLIFPLRESSRPLFESIMPVVVAVATAAFTVRYLRRVQSGYSREAILLGLMWLVINIAIDLPLMLLGPIDMTLGAYIADIGLTYLIIPAVTITAGLACEQALARQGAPNMP